MLDSRRLVIFCAVAEDGSFTAAASRLNLTQSAVSQQIAILERDVGALLMERVPRGVELTSQGRFLFSRAPQLLRDLTRLEQELRYLTQSPKKVHLGVFATAGAHLVPVLVAKYRQRHPDVQLVLRASQRENVASELFSGEIDVGITWDYDFLPSPFGELHRLHLLTDPLCLILPQGHPFADKPGPFRLSEFAFEPWIIRHHHTPPYNDAFELMCRISGFEPTIAFRAEDYQSVQGFVASNIGIAVAPQLSLSAQRSDVVVKSLHSPSFSRRIDAVALPDYARNPFTSQLIDVLTAISKDFEDLRHAVP